MVDIIGAQKRAHLQIFLNRHGCENIAGLGHKPHALGHTGLRGQLGDILAAQFNRAAIQVKHTKHGLHGGGFTSPVGANNYSNFAFINGNSAFMQDVRAFAVATRHVFAN